MTGRTATGRTAFPARTSGTSRVAEASGVAEASAARSSTPQAGMVTGGANPVPDSSRVSARNRCSSPRLAGPPWAR